MEVNKRLGDYEILAEIGSGGMGRVFRVRNVISDRIEAMKVLLPDLVGRQDLAARFVREIKVLATLSHPNIAQLRTALTADNQLVMIMEYVEGQSLADRLSYGPIATADAVAYIEQALDALAYAHRQQVVHRDIKPANMMLTPGGLVKLTDFGIARAANDHTLTVTGTTTGSLSYMSPEQVHGEATDARSDLYSVGISLYEMVTGQRPFQAVSDFAMMLAHLEERPKPPVDLQPGLPSGLNDIILKAIEKDPATRFQSADEFRQALQAMRGTRDESPARTETVLAAAALPSAAKPAAPGGSGARASMAGTGSDHARTVLDTRTPVVGPAAAARTAPPPAVPQAQMRSGHPLAFVALGAVLVVAALVGTGLYLRSAEAGSSPEPRPLVSKIPVDGGNEGSGTKPVPDPKPGDTKPGDTGGENAAGSGAEPLPGDANGGRGAPPAMEQTSPTRLPVTGGTTGASNAVDGAGRTAATTTTGASRQQGGAGAVVPNTGQREGVIGTEPARKNQQETANATATGNATQAAEDVATRRQAAEEAAALDKLEVEVDQLAARAAAVNSSLDRMQQQQARQGFGLRGDMVAHQEGMRQNLAKAQEALDRKDVPRTTRFRDAAERDVEALERFLGR
jgi:serine/threonine-protein kinase